jgi:hypothetical protein
MANYVAKASSSSGVAAWQGNGRRLMGFSAQESAATAAAASFVLRDGTDSTGAAVAFVQLGADQSINGDFGGIGGIEITTGLFIDRVAGSTEVTVYF